MPTVYPCPGPRDRRPGDQGRLARSRSSSPATSPPSAAWSIRTAPARIAGGLEQFCPKPRPSPTTRPTSTSAASPTAATPRASSSTSASSCASPRTSTSPAPRRCSAPASRPTRPCATGRRQGQEGRRGRSRRPRPHGREVRPCLRRPRRRLHHVARQDGGCPPPRRRRGRRLPTNADEMQKHAGSFDFILDTVSAEHDVNAYLNLLRTATAT